jgi:DNA-directed RNA polymerase subunit RPC12/RpoP
VQAQQTSIHCPHCGYDLRGHTGRSICPECGRDLTAPAPDVECPKCGEAVPAGFDVCWNCGAEVRSAQPPEP